MLRDELRSLINLEQYEQTEKPNKAQGGVLDHLLHIPTLNQIHLSATTEIKNILMSWLLHLS